MVNNPLRFHLLDFEFKNEIPFFKSDCIEDYKRFRSLMQILDLLLLDLNAFKFDKRSLVAAVFYVQMGISLKAFTREEISLTEDIPLLLMSIEQEQEEFSQMAQHFLESYFSIFIPEIVPAISFVARFFALETSEEMPIIIKNKKEVASVNSHLLTTYSPLRKSSIHIKSISKAG